MKTKPDEKTEELVKILADVEAELAGLAKSEALLKADPGEETSEEVPPSASATDKAPDKEAPAEAPPAPAADAAPPATDSAAPAPAPEGDPAADPNMDPAALKAEFASMPLDHLKMFYLACKEALFEAMGAGGEAVGGEDAGAPAPAAEPAVAPAPVEAPAMKSEDSKLLERLAKSEKALAGLTKVVSGLMDLPERKAATSLLDDEVKQSVPQLSKAEARAKLRKAAERDLSKSDRTLINQYDVGSIGIEKVAHLLDLK